MVLGRFTTTSVNNAASLRIVGKSWQERKKKLQKATVRRVLETSAAEPSTSARRNSVRNRYVSADQVMAGVHWSLGLWKTGSAPNAARFCPDASIRLDMIDILSLDNEIVL
jgi:hypothetical protein